MSDDIIGNINDLEVSTTPVSQFKAEDVASGSDIIGHVDDLNNPIETKEEHFGTPIEQLKTGLEGIGEGVLGPLAPGAERLFGVNPEDIRARKEANPITHGLGQATGFVGSLATGLGEASLAGQVTNIGEHAAALLPATISKIAATGIKTGAEFAALAASDELSKLVEQDPGQTLGSAAINVGLSGIIGGAGGAVLGAVSPLWDKTKNVLGVEKLAADFMAETKAIQEAGDPVISATNEVNGRLKEVDEILNGGLKGKAIEKALPESTPENLMRVDNHLLEISNQAEKRIEKAAENAYLKGSVSKLEQDLKEFNEVITNPQATISDKWDALDQYKRASQGHANYNILTGGPEEKAVSKWIKPFNASLREAAENTSIWGEAGNIQKNVNKAVSAVYDAQKDFLPKVTTKELGERIADPNKLQTLLNQAEKGKSGLKANAVKNYLEATEKAADAINEAHINVGLEAPLESKLNPTPVINHALGTDITPGTNLARFLNKKGAGLLAESAGRSGGAIIGGSLGAIVGHPIAGAWMGEKILQPILTALAKPLAENAINAGAAKGMVEYIGNVFKGQKQLENSVSSLFVSGAKVIANELIPDQESRDKLEKSINHVSNNLDNAMQVGGSLAHYLPSHASTASALAAQSANYLNSLKPTQPVTNALDATPPIDKASRAKYNRALDIAQQPLMILKHVKDGTLQAQDIKTLNTIYPGLHKSIINKVGSELIDHKSKKTVIPYAQKVSMNLLMGGAAIDGTMTPQAMQSIINSSGLNPQAQASHGQQINQKQHKASNTELSQINKVNALYRTPLQSRAAQKSG